MIPFRDMVRLPTLATSGTRLFEWVPEFMRLGSRRVRSQVRLLGSAVLVGLVAGLGAVLFSLATAFVADFALGGLAGYWPSPRPAGEPSFHWIIDRASPMNPWMLLVLPALGGLASGLLVFGLAPEAEGHGTDAVIAAYHHRDGYIRPRVPLVKIFASALTIGTGGSGGREGPIAQIGAGFGSVLAGLLHLRPADRRVLCAAGMGAGIAAIFRAPLAGALFAAEVLYWSPEFEPDVIIPAGIASVVSYCTFGAFFGWKPLFATPDLTFSSPWQLAPYLLLALCMVTLAMLYTRTFYGFTGFFHRMQLPRALRPALGAAASGLIGVVLYFAFGRNAQVLSVLSFGYSSLQNAISNEAGLSVGVLLAIALGKILTTSLTIGSGGSGGVFGPSMVIGGCGGGALGVLLHRFFPALVPHPASFVLMGMAGFFAAAAKTPFSTLVIVTEMTGGYHLLLPALWVCALAFILSDRQSIYSSQLESRARSPAHRGTLAQQTLVDSGVSQYVRTPSPLPWLRPEESLSAVIDRLTQLRYAALPVTDAEQRLLGVVTLEDVLVASGVDSRTLIVAADLMRTDVTPILSGASILSAQEAFVENDMLALPVIDNERDQRVLGLVKRFDVASAYLRMVQGSTPGRPESSDNPDEVASLPAS
jgi:chloride channel protein, CIC family